MSCMMASIRQPSYFLSSGREKPITAWLECNGSHEPDFVMSPTSRARVEASRRFASSRPPSATQSGKQDASPLPDAAYGYIVAAASSPVARAESIFRTISAALDQLLRPAAFR